MIKLCVGIQRKEGRPDYGSAGATLSMEFEIAATPGDTAAIGEQVKAAYDLLNALADDELARQCGRTEAPAAAAARNGHATNGAAPASRPPQRSGRPYRHSNGTVSPGREIPNPPKSGKELYAWAVREEEEGSEGLVKQIIGFGKAQGFGPKIVQWDRQQATDAYVAVMQAQD